MIKDCPCEDKNVLLGLAGRIFPSTHRGFLHVLPVIHDRPGNVQFTMLPFGHTSGGVVTAHL